MSSDYGMDTVLQIMEIYMVNSSPLEPARVIKEKGSTAVEIGGAL